MINLVLLTYNFPISQGEFFIDDEIKSNWNKFEKIIVITTSEEKSNLSRFVPNNMQILTIQNDLTLFDKFKYITLLFQLFFFREIYSTFKNHKLKYWTSIFKIMVIDFVKATKHKKKLSELILQQKIDIGNTVFYSYWHDYKAFSLALLKKENKKIKCISRAHGWDIFSNRHNPPYLPFKKFIVSNLDKTYSISDAGKYEFEINHGCNFKNKIKVSRLGKLNSRTPKIKKENKELLVCSCSNIIPLKRIHLIINILSKLSFQDIRWVHFGDGDLKNELEQYSIMKISHINFQFKGNINNSEILDFYNQNYVDFFINVSESEGVPVSIMEALSAGIPVIATNVGGTSEVLNENFGFLLEKDFKIEKAVEIISQFLSLPEKTIENYRLNAYNFWKENYNAEKNYSDFFEEILNL